MTYRISKNQPAPRAEGLRWEERAPGLYAGEALVELDDIYAAVSVDVKWLDNGSGVSFHGTARWCEADGQTHLCPDGQHVESFVTYTADPHTVGTFSVDALAKEILLALIGEEPALTRDENPVVALSGTVKLNASIRHAAKSVQSVAAAANPATLLT